MDRLGLCRLNDTIVCVTLNKNKKQKAVAYDDLVILARVCDLDLGSNSS